MKNDLSETEEGHGNTQAGIAKALSFPLLPL